MASISQGPQRGLRGRKTPQPGMQAPNEPPVFEYRLRGSPLVGCLPMAALLFLMCLLPLVVYDVGRSAFEKLGLSPSGAAFTVLMIFVGSIVNIPVRVIQRDELQPYLPYGPWGMVYPRQYRRVQSRTVIAVNLGGCVVPVLVAAFQVVRLTHGRPQALFAAGVVSAANVFTCWRVARPMPGLGIVMPAFVSPLVSVLGTWLLLSGGSPGERAAVAFIAGVAGPVIGADLLHLRTITKTPVAVMSIGGAGTFDGIVLSGVLAALLA